MRPKKASTPLASAYQQNTSGYSSPTGYSGIPPVTFGPPGYAPPGSQYTGQYPATQSIPVIMPPPAPSTRITKATTARSRAQARFLQFFMETNDIFYPKTYVT